MLGTGVGATGCLARAWRFSSSELGLCSWGVAKPCGVPSCCPVSPAGLGCCAEAGPGLSTAPGAPWLAGVGSDARFDPGLGKMALCGLANLVPSVDSAISFVVITARSPAEMSQNQDGPHLVWCAIDYCSGDAFAKSLIVSSWSTSDNQGVERVA